MSEGEATASAAPLSEVAVPESTQAPTEVDSKTQPEIKDNAIANGSDVVTNAPQPEKEVTTEVPASVDGMSAA